MFIAQPVKEARNNTANGTITGFKAAYPKPNRWYIKVLVECTDCFKTVKELYPGVYAPKTQGLTDLVRLGYLDRYIDTDMPSGRSYGPRPHLYRTTAKGKHLVQVAFTKVQK